MITIIIFKQGVVIKAAVFRTSLFGLIIEVSEIIVSKSTITYKQTTMNELSHPHPSSTSGSGWPCESSYTLNKERNDVLFYFIVCFSFHLVNSSNTFLRVVLTAIPPDPSSP